MEGFNATARQGGRRLNTGNFVAAAQFKLGLGVEVLRPPAEAMQPAGGWGLSWRYTTT